MMDRFTEQSCIDQYLQKIQHLISVGLMKIGEENTESYLLQRYSGHEYCTNASLHRGFYHPSPIYDIVVGNTQRGRIHKAKPDQTKITHRFLYGADGSLDCVETYSQGRVAYVEHLYYDGDMRLGVSIDKNNRIAAVCEERFAKNQLVDFFILNCVFIDEHYECYSARSEHYLYNDSGLCECDFVVISPKSGSMIQKKYRFNREDGMLTSYTDALASNAKTPRVYSIKKKRKI